jgi:hypothetical protein
MERKGAKKLRRQLATYFPRMIDVLINQAPKIFGGSRRLTKVASLETVPASTGEGVEPTTAKMKENEQNRANGTKIIKT